MVNGTSDIGEALDLLLRVYTEAIENDWAVNYAKNTSTEFGARFSEHGDTRDLEGFSESVNISTTEVNAAIEKLIEIERKLPVILRYYNSLSVIGDAWILSIGTELLNRRYAISHYQ